MKSFASSLIIIGFLAGCAVGPDYKRPAALKSQSMPAGFSEQLDTNVWKIAEPSAQLPRGTWWEIFGDTELNRLENLANADNQDLAVNLARFDEARAQVEVARSDFFPTAGLSPNYSRQRTSLNAVENGHATGESFNYNLLNVPLQASWEVDFWGRVRRQVEAARARLAAVNDDLATARLAVQAELAGDYYTLRSLDAEYLLLQQAVQEFRKSRELTVNRRKGGVASDLDVSQAETQLRVTEAQLPVVALQRAKVFHGIATLCGQPASGFTIGSHESTIEAPSIPPMVPSELLERRPDIAAAEKRMAAANETIGVAKAAFYPRVVIHGLAGFQSISASALFDWPSRVWAIGPSVDFPLFTGGRNKAQLTAAKAAYDENVASYRQTVLAAFQETEDQMAAVHLLELQIEAETAALASSRKTLEIANNRYKAGLVTYLEVATAQTQELTRERTLLQLRGERLVAHVSMIKALGGGWRPNADTQTASTALTQHNSR